MRNQYYAVICKNTKTIRDIYDSKDIAEHVVRELNEYVIVRGIDNIRKFTKNKYSRKDIFDIVYAYDIMMLNERHLHFDGDGEFIGDS